MIFESALFNRSTRGNVWSVIVMALPLILASAAHSINLFVDRLMLQRFSEDAMSAAFPAGLTSFALSCYFVGTVGYANSFVAQYFGAKMYHRVGAAVWQAIYMALLGGLYAIGLTFFAEELFDFFGHEEHLREMEVTYFRLLGWGTVAYLLVIAMLSFWGGQGKTHMVMIFDLVITAANIPLNAMLIFGWKTPFFEIPAMGVTGAALGTVGASVMGLIVMVCIFFLPKKNRARYRTGNMKLDKDLFHRLFKFGGPNGVQLFLDLAAFNAFVILLGKIGTTEMNASGVAFSLNSLAMIPMFGLGQTVSILVGQGVGKNDIPYAERAVKSARFWLYLMMIVIGFLFVVYPKPALTLFNLVPGTEAYNMAKIMLWFITAYLLFDATSILYGSAVKGAGDTKFSMWIGSTFAWIFYGLPCLAVYYIFSSDTIIGKLGKDRADTYNLWILWTICVVYIMILGVTFYLRYRGGKWKKMKVIESEANDHPRGAIPKEVGVDTYLP